MLQATGPPWIDFNSDEDRVICTSHRLATCCSTDQYLQMKLCCKLDFKAHSIGRRIVKTQWFQSLLYPDIERMQLIGVGFCCTVLAHQAESAHAVEHQT